MLLFYSPIFEIASLMWDIIILLPLVTETLLARRNRECCTCRDKIILKKMPWRRRSRGLTVKLVSYNREEQDKDWKFQPMWSAELTVREG